MLDFNHVGYKNPPKQTRFQKGKSGNPKGRPKKKKSSNVISEIIQEILDRECKVRSDDKVSNMKFAEALLRKTYKAGLNGDIKSAEKFLLIYAGSRVVSKKFKLEDDEINQNMNHKTVLFSEWKKLSKRLQKEYIPLKDKDYKFRDIAIKIANESIKVPNSNKRITKLRALIEVIAKKSADLDHRATNLLLELMPASEFKDQLGRRMFSAEEIRFLDGL